MEIDTSKYYTAKQAQIDTKNAQERLDKEIFERRFDDNPEETRDVLDSIKAEVALGHRKLQLTPAPMDEYEEYAKNKKVIPYKKTVFSNAYQDVFINFRVLGYGVNIYTAPVVLDNDDVNTIEEAQQKSRPIQVCDITW